MGRLFGTDGVRGIANKELTAELAFSLGMAGAQALAQRTGRRPLILIGKDTRVSCDMLEGAMVAGICTVGADAMSLGVIPTPAVACLASTRRADAGVVISASHNSFEFNGIKFFDGRGFKLPDAIEDQIESLVYNRQEACTARPTGDGIGRHSVFGRAKDEYIERLIDIAARAAGQGEGGQGTVGQVADGQGTGGQGADGQGADGQGAGGRAPDLRGVTVALDCANGAACKVAPQLFRKLGADVHVTSGEPSGMNINSGCGSTHIGKLRGFAERVGADVGFAFDGDADRVIAVDERGGVVDGDMILAMLALDMKRRGALRRDTVVATVMSNLGLEIAARENGIKLVRTSVGDRYVLEEMIKGRYTLGGEQSGHVICLDGHTTGDGLFTALLLSGILVSSGKPFSELAAVMRHMPQIICNARVPNEKKSAYLEDDVIRGRCEELEAAYAGEGRVLIRPSGTEPLVRVMIEAGDEAAIRRQAEEMANLIEARLG